MRDGVARVAMEEARPLAIEASRFDCDELLQEWRWLVPPSAKPLLIGAFGDWVFGAPDGGVYMLCLFEGTFERVADSTAEFNRLKEQEQFRDDRFHADWVTVAAAHGLVPKEDECLGWKAAPIFGGPFRPENIAIYPMVIYQSLQGELHRQLREQALLPRRRRKRRSQRRWWRFW